MKQALVIGGASENGRVILDTLLENNFKIVNVGSSVYEHDDVTNIKINWNDIDIEFVQKCFSKFDTTFDFVFFNQNSSSLNKDDYSVDHDDILEVWKRVKDWSNSHWLSCQLPFLILHTIRNNLCADSKVGWMLSGYMDYTNPGSMDHTDYSSFKYFNYLSMKSFGTVNEFKTFGIYPTFTDRLHGQEKLKNIINDIVNNRSIESEFKF